MYASASKTFLVKMDLSGLKQQTAAAFHYHLDCLERKTSGSYSGVTGLTTWTFQAPAEQPTDTYKLIEESTGKELQITVAASGGTVTAIGNYSTSAVLLGIPFTSTLQMSEPILKDEQGSSIENAEIKILNVLLSFEDTGYFKVTSTPKRRSGFSKEFFWLETSVDTINTVVLKDSAATGYPFWKAPVYAGAKGLTLTLTSDSYLPCKITNLALELDVERR
jgi:hypothetical protein